MVIDSRLRSKIAHLVINEHEFETTNSGFLISVCNSVKQLTLYINSTTTTGTGTPYFVFL